MVRKAPIAVASLAGPDPAACRAWCSLGEPAPAAVELVRRASDSKPAVYRLIFEGPGRPAVYAKRSGTSQLASELAIYEEILPRLPLTVPHYFGSYRDRDGATWLFVEDVGDRRLVANLEDRRLAARWLAGLHRMGAADPAAAGLPDGGPARYLAHLLSGRHEICRHLGNPALTEEERAVLAGLIEDLGHVESQWPRIERACAGVPATLVHGDFRPKNARVRGMGVAAALYVLDWEMAGWGAPAADLAGATDPGQTIAIDPGTYLQAVRTWWRDVDAEALRRLSIAGRIFQALAGIAWAAPELVFESARHLVRPLGSIRIYRTQLAQAFAADGEHLE